MKRAIFALAFLIHVFLCVKSYAENLKIDSTSFTVKLINPKLDNNQKAIINIQVSQFPFIGVEFYKARSTTYEQRFLPGQANVFNVAAPASTFYMFIYVTGLKKSDPQLNWIDNVYLINAHSRLTIELSPNNVVFSGEGSNVPNLQSKIIKLGYILKTSDHRLFNEKRYLSYLQKFDKSLDSSLRLQLKIIQENKSHLGDYYTKLLIANCYGLRYFTQLRSYSTVQDSMFLGIMKNYYSNKKQAPKKVHFSNEILEDSPSYANYILEELNLKERLRHSKVVGVLPDSSISNIINIIRRDYDGDLRDKLLTLLVIRYDKNMNASAYLDTVFSIVENTKYKEFLRQRKQRYDSGKPFRSFVLSDTVNRQYSLENFKNKVILMDFWYSGCVNCVELTKNMKPVYDHFNGNDSVVFMSVSIDKDRSQWVNSVRSGLYAHDGSINLYTNGEGKDNDLIKYYNISGYPTVFVIKNGKMVSSLPPRPVGREKEVAELIQLLEDTINK